MRNTAQEYQVFNQRKEDCPVCAGLNSIYRADLVQNEIKIPEEIGKGYWRRMIVKSSMEISICDVTFYEDIVMRGNRDNSLYCLAFCLGAPLLWRVEGQKQEYEIAGGESLIFRQNRKNGICNYDAGQRFLGIMLYLDAKTMTSLIPHIDTGHSHAGAVFDSSVFYRRRKFPPAISLILNEMMRCRYQGHVQRIYLEGKILELIAIYLEETVFEQGKLYAAARLSKTDIKSLYEARRILDDNIASPPTIGKLAKMLCLNEYKLKTGFKELFGMPVHAYVIDKRLETARFLLEDKKMKVTEAVLQVGYSDASHFAEKFRRKYGINPSEYA